MRDWSDRLSEHSVPWVLSLLLHAGIFLLIRSWATAPLVPYGQGAVEVMLVGGLSGGGGASDSEATGRGEAGGGGVASTAERSKVHPRKGLNAPPSPSRMKQQVPTTSTPSHLAKAEPINGPRVLPQALEISDAESSDPVSLDEAKGEKEVGLSSLRTHTGPEREEKAGLAHGRQRPGSGAGGGEDAGSWGREGDGGRFWGTLGGSGTGLGTGTGPGAGPETGSGTGAGTSVGQGGRGGDWRRLLLQRIERAKRYPAQARRWGLEGTAEVQFRIAGDGSVEAVTVVKSSGFALLDRASVETIKRAAPLPVISGTIRVPISYRLRDAQ